MFGLELAENELVYLIHDCPIGGITGGEYHCRTSAGEESISHGLAGYYIGVAGNKKRKQKTEQEWKSCWMKWLIDNYLGVHFEGAGAYLLSIKRQKHYSCFQWCILRKENLLKRKLKFKRLNWI